MNNVPQSKNGLRTVGLEQPARLVRRALRRMRQMLRYRRITFAGVPILFANSFPKSGTHLLTQVLQGFTSLGPAVNSGLPAIVTFDGDTGRPRQVGEILGDLKRLLPGDIAFGHLQAFPEVVTILCREGWAAYFILRDPRDVALSHVHYVTEMEPGHVHHSYYTQVLSTFEERLRTSITGIPDSPVPFPDIAARFVPYLAWLEHPEVLALRYEDFIAQRDATLERVYRHALARGFPASLAPETAIHSLAAAIAPQKSPTFRSGKTGGWRDHFSRDHRQLFKEVAGDLLIRLEYERDHDW